MVEKQTHDLPRPSSNESKQRTSWFGTPSPSLGSSTLFTRPKSLFQRFATQKVDVLPSRGALPTAPSVSKPIFAPPLPPPRATNPPLVEAFRAPVKPEDLTDQATRFVPIRNVPVRLSYVQTGAEHRPVVSNLGGAPSPRDRQRLPEAPYRSPNRIAHLVPDSFGKRVDPSLTVPMRPGPVIRDLPTIRTVDPFDVTKKPIHRRTQSGSSTSILLGDQLGPPQPPTNPPPPNRRRKRTNTEATSTVQEDKEDE